MKKTESFLHSGLIELYVLGLATAEERGEVDRMAVKYPEVLQEIYSFSEAIEQQAHLHAVPTPRFFKVLLMAYVDFLDRRRRGLVSADQPRVSPGSSLHLFNTIRHSLFSSSTDPLRIYVINQTPHLTTALVWLMGTLAEPPAYDELQAILVLDGICEIKDNQGTRTLAKGMYHQIASDSAYRIRVAAGATCIFAWEKRSA
ncbi:hypothetical protein [Terrimonas ferruginea]|uniref:hypothetical protein n=1 Tax=Terrimonas ferruginea TaxID=249 RepID=UPI000421C664|nr:hypothetical protein [Terrimonas ferruginea]